MRYLCLLWVLLVAACAGGTHDTRPELLRQADGYLAQAHSAYATGDYAQATQRYRQALLAYRSIDHPEGEVLSRFGLVNLSLALHRVVAGEEQLTRAEQRIEFADLDALRPRLALLRAEQALANGANERALAWLATQQQAMVSHPSLAWSAQVLRCRLADGSELAGCVEQLRTLLVADDHRGEARLARFDAQLAGERGELVVAYDRYHQALSHYRVLADRPGIAATLGEWGALELAAGELGSAQDRLRRALFIRIWLLQREQGAILLEQLGECYRLNGDMAASEWALRWRDHLRGESEEADWSRLKGALDEL